MEIKIREQIANGLRAGVASERLRKQPFGDVVPASHSSDCSFNEIRFRCERRLSSGFLDVPQYLR